MWDLKSAILKITICLFWRSQVNISVRVLAALLEGVCAFFLYFRQILM
jgi:hypothetical protein